MLDVELRLLRRYLSRHPAEAARALEKLPRQEAATILADQTAELAAELAARMRWAAASSSSISRMFMVGFGKRVELSLQNILRSRLQ